MVLDEDSGGDSTPSTKLPVPHVMKSNMEEAAAKANILEQAPTVAGDSSTEEEFPSGDSDYDPFTEGPAPHVLEANRKAATTSRQPWLSQRALRALGAPAVGGDSSTEESLSESEATERTPPPPWRRQQRRSPLK